MCVLRHTLMIDSRCLSITGSWPTLLISRFHTHYCVLVTHEPQGSYLGYRGMILVTKSHTVWLFSQNDGHYLTWCQEVSAWISWAKNRTTGGLKLITTMGREKATNLMLLWGMINLIPGAVATELMVIRRAIGKLAVYRVYVATLPGIIYIPV